MRLVRFGPPGRERPGLWLDRDGDAAILDVRAMAYDIADFDERFFARHGLARLRGLLAEPNPRLVPARGVRLGPPVARPGQLVCVGKNYADHAAEFDAEVPTAPLLFAKATSSLIGPEDPIRIPAGFREVDAEAELAVVIGAPARRVTEHEALHRVAGYTVLNDVTERAAQREGKQWFRGKSFDTFCPLGPWLVTTDEVPDPQDLAVRSRRNGQPLQDGHTRDMLFPVARLIAYISATQTLYPGDVIATGTPAGVGFARRPPVLLTGGDVIEVEVERLGRLRNAVVAEA